MTEGLRRALEGEGGARSWEPRNRATRSHPAKQGAAGAVGECSLKLPLFLFSVPPGVAVSANTHCFMRKVSSYICVTVLIHC